MVGLWRVKRADGFGEVDAAGVPQATVAGALAPPKSQIVTLEPYPRRDRIGGPLQAAAHGAGLRSGCGRSGSVRGMENRVARRVSGIQDMTWARVDAGLGRGGGREKVHGFLQPSRVALLFSSGA